MGSVTSNPSVNVQLLPAAVVDAFADRRDLIFGQIQGSGATAVSKALNTNVHQLSTTAIRAKFGTGSSLTQSILDWKTVNGGHCPLDVVGIDEGTGAATAVVTFTGTTATAAGSFTIKAVDGKKYGVTVDVAIDDTPTDIGDAFTAAINAVTDVAITASNIAGACTFTVNDLGDIGEYYSIDVQGQATGITMALTNGFTGSGSGPTIDDTLLDNIDGIRYTGIMWPECWQDDVDVLTDELILRFNASNRILDGVAFMGASGTYAETIAIPTAENTQTLVVFGNRTSTIADEHAGGVIVRNNDWLATEFMGIRSRRMTTGAPIADYIVSTSGTLDTFGGPSLASLPYFNTPMNLTDVTVSTHQWTSTEQADLENNGASAVGVNSAQNAMITQPVVTTYLNDGAGNENGSFKYLNYVDTGSACREVFYNVLKSVYSQSRLTEGDLIPNRSMANAESIKAECLRIYKTLSTLGLTQAGREAESYFSQNTTVTVSLVDRSATISSLLPIVTQLGVINYSLQLSFTITGTGTQITV